MALSRVQKLRIKENNLLLTINGPRDFREKLGPLPAGVKHLKKASNPDQIHWFVKARDEMEKELPGILALLKAEVICWIYYPKGSSGIQTDLTRDKGWDTLLAHEEFQWISLLSFDETWSTFGMRLKNKADRQKEQKPKRRPVFDYIDAAIKTVYPPAGFLLALENNSSAYIFFNSLSFTNKKEYIEWVVTAKREETKTKRIADSIERLEKRWKNPANR